MSQDLPAFHKPPVIEVALAVAFEPTALTSPLAVLLWNNHYAADLPDLEEVGPIEPQIEKFGGSRAGGTQIRFGVWEQPPPRRLWMKDLSGRTMLQVQKDWMARNWLRQEDGDEYPRYPAIRDPFAIDLANLRTFLLDRGFEEPRPIQCEVVYVNHIVAGPAWSDWGDLSEVFRGWASMTTDFLPKVEEASCSAHYVIEQDGKPIGRLHADLSPGTRISDNAKLFVLTMTVRGEPVNSEDDLLAFHDLGHEWIVRGFTDLTTERMHEEWERYQ